MPPRPLSKDIPISAVSDETVVPHWAMLTPSDRRLIVLRRAIALFHAERARAGKGAA